jgi:5-methylcytosine-specific restriction endonuclease McrA
MLWRPATQGELTFLTIYEVIGRYISVDVPAPLTLDFLVNEHSFQDFARLHATIEIFVRCTRAAAFLQPQINHLSAQEFGKQLAKLGYLSRHLSSDRRFCELVKQTARISVEAKPAKLAVAKEIRESASVCYMCGVKLMQSGGGRNQATTEHLWPLSLGGESIESNLIGACQDCNEKRENSITWAWGPVQSTDYRHSHGKNPNVNLRISLAMAKLMMEASGERRAGQTTLKEAALQHLPLFPTLSIKDDRHRVYFELLDEVRRTV